MVIGRVRRVVAAARSAGPVQARRRTSLGADAGRAADVGLEAVGARPDRAQVGVVPADLAAIDTDARIAPPPRGEARVHRLEALPGALVGVGDDPLLARRERRPAPVALAVDAGG